MHCLRDGAGDHARQYHRLLLSLQRSPGLDVVSILLVGPPPWVRRALSDRMAHRSRKKFQVGLSRFFFFLIEPCAGLWVSAHSLALVDAARWKAAVDLWHKKVTLTCTNFRGGASPSPAGAAHREGSCIGRVAVKCHQKLFSRGFLCCTTRNRLPSDGRPLTKL